jgi:hypothetical protein
MMLST